MWSKRTPLHAHVLIVKSSILISWSNPTKTNEDIMAKSSLCSPTAPKILPIHLSRVLAGECRNTINTAGIFLNKQKVTLNGSEDLPTVCGNEKWNTLLCCFRVTDVWFTWCRKPCTLYLHSPFWLWVQREWEDTCILGNPPPKVTRANKYTWLRYPKILFWRQTPHWVAARGLMISCSLSQWRIT